MAKWEQVHHPGNPIDIRVGNNADPVRVVPVIYDTPEIMGPGVRLPNDTYRAGSLIANPRDIFSAWRGTEVLQAYDGDQLPDLQELSYATTWTGYEQRRPQGQEIIDTVGSDRFADIMRARVPLSLVDLTLRLQGQEAPPDLDVITDEVRKGTIEWRDYFGSYYDIKHPDEVDRQEQGMSTFLADNETAIGSAVTYLKDDGGSSLVRNRQLMADAVRATFSREATADLDPLMRITYALADASGVNRSMLSVESAFIVTDKDYEHFSNLSDHQGLATAAKWHARYSGFRPGFLRRNPEYSNKVEETTMNLARLLVGVEDEVQRKVTELEQEKKMRESRPYPY